MSQKYPLQETLSPINREGRDRINENWTRIMAYFDYVQSQVKVLAGGQEVDELITRLEQAIDKAEIDVQKYIVLVDTTVKQAIEANNTATQDAIAANNAALQTALDTVAERLIEVTQAINNAETATEDATNAKDAAIQATQDAQDAISTMQSLIDNFSHRGAWSSATQYYKNNLAEVDGRTYIALKENINTPVTNKSTWALFADKGATGATGPQGLPGKDGKDGTGVNIIGGLTSEDELPTVGTPGDAYMIGGDLYVWQDDTSSWKNVGPIQGPEGKSAFDLAVANGFEGTMEEWIDSLKGEIGPPGPEGPQGPPGKDADLTEVTEQLDQMKPKVDNSWQKDVYNDTDITNLGFMSASKVFRFDEWDVDNSKLDSMYINIPVGNAFSGLVKLTLTSNYNFGNAMGGAEIVYNVAKVGEDVFLNTMTINHISPDFATCFYVKPLVSMSERMYIPITKAPNTRNPINIKVEIFSAYAIFDAVNNITLARDSSISQPHPWTPQTTSFMDKKQNNLISGSITSRSTFPLIFAPDGTQSHVFHKNPNLYIAPAEKDGSSPNWGLATIFMLDGTVHMPKLIVDGVDLKQSVSEGKADNRATLAQRGVIIPENPTYAQISQGIRDIPTGSKTQSGAMQIPAFSGSQTVSVNVYLPFVAKNALNNMGGFVLLNGYPYGGMGVAGPYTRNITVAGTTLTFTFAMGGGTGSFAGGTGTYFASE